MNWKSSLMQNIKLSGGVLLLAMSPLSVPVTFSSPISPARSSFLCLLC